MPDTDMPNKKEIGEDNKHLLSYSRHLERRLEALETEIKILEDEKKRLRSEKIISLDIRRILDKLKSLKSKITMKEIHIKEIEIEIDRIINIIKSLFDGY